MRMRLNRKNILLLLLVSVLLSCVRERCSSCNQEKGSNEQFKVSFSGNYAITKSASVFPAGVETSIFAYYSGEDPSIKREHPGTPIKAISDISGNFQLGNNFEFYLSPGYYDFYAISANSSSLNGFSFKMGQSDTLKNGIDYLWAQKRDITICNHSNIQFSFKHAAVSIIIEVNPNVDSQVDSQQVELNRALIGVPITSQILKLAGGEIIPAKTISTTKAQMYVHSNMASYIILPLEREIEIPVQLDITTTSSSNKKTNETYYCTLPSPQNGFMGGMQYRYRATISLSKVVIGTTSVEQWNEKEIANIYLNEML